MGLSIETLESKPSPDDHVPVTTHVGPSSAPPSNCPLCASSTGTNIDASSASSFLFTFASVVCVGRKQRVMRIARPDQPASHEYAVQTNGSIGISCQHPLSCFSTRYGGRSARHHFYLSTDTIASRPFDMMRHVLYTSHTDSLDCWCSVGTQTMRVS